MPTGQRIRIEALLWLKGLLLISASLVPLGVLFFSVRSLQSDQARAIEKLRQSVQIYRELQAIRMGLAGAETSLAAYLLQGKEEVLLPYKTARTSLPARLGALETLLGSESVQFKRLEALHPLIERRLSLLTDLRKYAPIPGVSTSPLPAVPLGESQSVTRQIHSLLGEIQRDEDLRLERASDQAWRAQNRADAVLLGTLAFVLLGGITAVWLLVSSVARSERRRAEEAFQNSQRLLRDLLKGTETQVRELANTEKVLRYQTGVLQSVLHNMSDGVVVAGEDGGLLLSNKAAGQLLEGLPNTHSSKWIARYGFCLADGATPCPPAEFPLERALRGQYVDQAVLFAARAQAAGGAWINMTARPMKDEAGAVKGCVLVMSDITPLKRTERMLSRAKEEAERAREEALIAIARAVAQADEPAAPRDGAQQALELTPTSPA